MLDPETRPPRSPRVEPREVVELRALRDRHPELAEAVALHLELHELRRRIQSRVPLPSFDVSAPVLARHAVDARPLLRFEDIPLELSDLRLMVRQTADVLRRHGALEDADHKGIELLGRDMELLRVVGRWYRNTAERASAASVGGPALIDTEPGGPDGMVGQVLLLAMRPFLSRCAEVLQQRPDLDTWTHAFCALCGGDPELAVITPAAERHLICGRCSLQWKFAPLTCPYCLNSDRGRITSFATPDGRYRVYACDVCQRYLKAYDARRASRPVMPVVDSVATLPLDAAAMQRGYTS